MGNFQTDGQHGLKLSDLLYFIIRRKWSILAVILFFAITAYLYTVNTYVPLYTATASMVINTKTDAFYRNDGENPNSEDIYLAENLVNTYTLVLKSNRVMQHVVNRLNLNIPASLLQNYVSLNTVKDTQVLYLTVTCPDPQLAVNVANALMEVAPQAMMETVEIGSINVLDKAVLPTAPAPVNPAKNILLAAVIGLIVGGGLSLLLGMVLFKIKDASDIEESFTIPTLGEIAHVKREYKKEGMLLNSPKTPSSSIENYMMLGTIVRYVTNNSHIKKLMITSTLENEGKTLTSINLAMALASSGKSVLLIDCDLRKPSVGKLLNIPRDAASDLCNVLDADHPDGDLSQCIYQMPSPVGLSILPYISPLDKRKDIFSTPSFNNAVSAFAQQYDYILFDTAPAYTITDTINLVGAVEGVILIVRQEYASLKIITEAVNKLTKVGANIIGCVLNDIKYHKLGSGHSYKYKYYYRYYYKKYAYDREAALLVPDALKEKHEAGDKSEATSSK